MSVTRDIVVPNLIGIGAFEHTIVPVGAKYLHTSKLLGDVVEVVGWTIMSTIGRVAFFVLLKK